MLVGCFFFALSGVTETQRMGRRMTLEPEEFRNIAQR